MNNRTTAWHSPWVACVAACVVGTVILAADVCVEGPPQFLVTYEAYDFDAHGLYVKGTVEFHRDRGFAILGRQWWAIRREGHFDFFYQDTETASGYHNEYEPKAIAEASKKLPRWSVNVPVLLGEMLVYAACCWILWVIFNTRRVRSKIELAAPFVTPFLFAVIYEPFNESSVVERFGCGCVNWSFNANDFNAIMFVLCWVFAMLCAIVWSRGLRRSVRVAYVIIADLFVGASCFFLCPIWR